MCTPSLLYLLRALRENDVDFTDAARRCTGLVLYYICTVLDGYRAAKAVNARADAVGSICTLCSLHMIHGVMNGDFTARGGIILASAAAAADAGSTSTARGINRAAADGDISTRATIIGAFWAASSPPNSVPARRHCVLRRAHEARLSIVNCKFCLQTYLGLPQCGGPKCKSD